jgi:hypothetical protein
MGEKGNAQPIRNKPAQSALTSITMTPAANATRNPKAYLDMVMAHLPIAVNPVFINSTVRLSTWFERVSLCSSIGCCDEARCDFFHSKTLLMALL